MFLKRHDLDELEMRIRGEMLQVFDQGVAGAKLNLELTNIVRDMYDQFLTTMKLMQQEIDSLKGELDAKATDQVKP